LSPPVSPKLLPPPPKQRKDVISRSNCSNSPRIWPVTLVDPDSDKTLPKKKPRQLKTSGPCRLSRVCPATGTTTSPVTVIPRRPAPPTILQSMPLIFARDLQPSPRVRNGYLSLAAAPEAILPPRLPLIALFRPRMSGRPPHWVCGLRKGIARRDPFWRVEAVCYAARGVRSISSPRWTRRTN
jgi:hypothetical protein